MSYSNLVDPVLNGCDTELSTETFSPQARNPDNISWSINKTSSICLLALYLNRIVRNGSFYCFKGGWNLENLRGGPLVFTCKMFRSSVDLSRVRHKPEAKHRLGRDEKHPQNKYGD